MEQFKPTVALNRAIDRSDEMAWGFTLPLFHPDPHPPLTFFLNHSAHFFSTAEFHLYVNKEKGAILKLSPPTHTHCSCPFLLSLIPVHSTPNHCNQEKGAVNQCRAVKTLNNRMWWWQTATYSVVLYSPTVTLLTPEPRTSGLVILITRALFDGHPPVYLLQGKMGNTCWIGRDVEGEAVVVKRKIL